MMRRFLPALFVIGSLQPDAAFGQWRAAHADDSWTVSATVAAGEGVAGQDRSEPPSAFQTANVGIRFALELAALGVLGYWGARTGKGRFDSVVRGIGIPLAAAAAWGAFGSPNAPFRAPAPVRLGLEAAIFGSAAAALADVGRPGWAAVFGAGALINGVVLHAAAR